MTEILAIAKNTFKEAVRNRILYVILIFALLLITSSGVLSELTIASREKLMRSLGFTAINLFGVAIAVFVGVSLVYNELEKKTIYTIVSKPIGRWQFLLGKYFGLLMTVWVNVLIMSIFFLAALHYYYAAGQPGSQGFLMTVGLSLGKALANLFLWNSFEPTLAIMPVIAITCLELAIVTAFAILYSSFSTPTLSMFFTILTFVAGRMNEDIIRFTEQVVRNTNKMAQTTGGDVDLPLTYHLANVAAHISPNLGAFTEAVKSAVYERETEILEGSVLYGILYSAGVLCLAIMIFQRRNFK
jgi:ABC-type transport system involved in multi-copper enzyme maturation permease subunit